MNGILQQKVNQTLEHYLKSTIDDKKENMGD
jgi:hypothetical protein